jgi:hypothetical protein
MTGLDRLETLAPNPKLTFLAATIGAKADIPLRHVDVGINGDRRLFSLVQR